MQNSQKDFYQKLLGRKGERRVVKEMKKMGYRLIKRNYRTPVGEADIVMDKGDTVYFIEVKTRSGLAYGEPKEAVDRKKQLKYRKIANYYMACYGESEVSFVVAEVMSEKRKMSVNIITDAF